MAASWFVRHQLVSVHCLEIQDDSLSDIIYGCLPTKTKAFNYAVLCVIARAYSRITALFDNYVTR